MGLEKAKLINTVTGEEVLVLFNPTEYSVEKGNQFAEIAIPGLEAPLLQFSRGNARTLTMDLFLDTTENNEDVRTYLKKITALLDIQSDTHAPPVCDFVWGGGETFRGVMEKASQRFTMFLSDGTPIRATVNVSIKEFKSGLSSRETPLESPDRTKVRTALEGDSLWFLAAKEYGDPAQWRFIAHESGIANPRILRPGQEIVLPPIE
ncbi:MAG: peptidoglycan-binding protein [Nitrospirota bacterium]|nr:peptidoglycan-binding protein [Nitrospirota bacterium]